MFPDNHWAAATASALEDIRPAQWLQGYFVLAASGCLVIAALPKDTKRLILDYGARSVPPLGHVADETLLLDKAGAGSWHNGLVGIIETVTAWTQVPHSWFAAFYPVSLAMSIFWLHQYLSHGGIMRTIAASQARDQTESATMNLEQVLLAWALMLLQAARRFYEQVHVTKPSASRMWVVHLVLGLSFYPAMSMAVWIEGSSVMLGKAKPMPRSTMHVLRLAGGIAMALFAWVNQYRCHKHLAGLRKYSVPQEGLFRWFICPHYTCECLFYLAISLLGAPGGQVYNTTLLTACLFVAVNLGVTATRTRSWYYAKFGPEAVDGKWNMIPFVF